MNKDNEIVTVPYCVVESLIMVHKKQMLHLALVFLFIIITLVAGFVYAWTSYDYESTETTTTTVQQDGSGVNIFGDENEVDNGSANKDNPDQN